MSHRSQSIISGLVTILFYAAVTWGEFGGIVHAFKHHSVGDGLAAVFVPPWAWYRSVEFFFHRASDSRPETKWARNGSEDDQDYPPLNAEETAVISRVMSKAMEQPLSETDLQQYKETMIAYGRRTGIPATKRDVAAFLALAELGEQYQREMGRCLLASIDQKKPFISPELEQLRKRLEQTETVRPAKLEADFRNIESAAFGTPLTDEFGRQHLPPTREEIINALKKEDMVHDNLQKLAHLIDEARPSPK